MAIESPYRSVSTSSSALTAWVRALEKTAPIPSRPGCVLPDVIEDLSGRFADAPALLSDLECLSFRALARRMNQYARWAIACGLTKNSTVALLMPNRPEYMAIWLGVTRIGGVVALLNTNLEGQSLAHCIDIVAPSEIVVAAELLNNFKSAEPHLKSRARVWIHGEADASTSRRIDLAIADYGGGALETSERRLVTIQDRALYIYTSGTTGLPKAANVSHQRLMVWSHWFAGMLETKPSDRMYNCLPMYHSIGGTVATGAVLVNGGSVVIRQKFSQNLFWDDVVGWECTLVQYIGELCRYLLSGPPHPLERSHNIRAFCGNGLRAEIWNTFKDRFAIPQILEFYAATEGNFSLFNVEERPGALGRVPPFLAHSFPAALVKFDTGTGEPARDCHGRCIPCAPNETGEALGPVGGTANGHAARFEGYSNEADSQKKILRNVFRPGDAWYRTGDLMRKDAMGFWYFVDRIGDTFRWKGENVSTLEVVEAFRSFPQIKDAAVYGVAVPKAEGRAGMAALIVDGHIDLDTLRLHLSKSLPSYAIPLFLRICDELEVTSTFKQKKTRLALEGFDPAQSKDAIYFNDRNLKRYVRLDSDLFERIRLGDLRL